MNNHAGASVLGREFSRRIAQLGLSRRELTKRSGLSRQTLHNIEHGGHVELLPGTFATLDAALMWQPGTALALSQGDLTVLETADAMMHADKEGAYRWRIVERIQRMSLTDLEHLVSIMESEAFDREPDDTPLTTDDVIARVEQSIMDRIEKRLAEYRGNGQTAER